MTSVWVQLDARGNGVNLEASDLVALLPADEYIVIQRADLPTVAPVPGTKELVAGSSPEKCNADPSENPEWLRSHARSALALADHIEAAQAAEAAIDWLAVDKLQGLLGEAVSWTGEQSVVRTMAEHLVREGVALPEHLR